MDGDNLSTQTETLVPLHPPQISLGLVVWGRNRTSAAIERLGYIVNKYGKKIANG